MDAQFWIYIVIGVIYFLSKLLKKPEEASGGAPDKQPTQRKEDAGTDRPRQLTFEELLREITEGKQAPKPAAPKTDAPKYAPVERRRQEAQTLSPVDVEEAENARVFQRYEEAQAMANERKSLEETLRLEDTVVDFKRFEAFERKKPTHALQEYLKIIRDPERLKHAVVMNEILKRKF